MTKHAFMRKMDNVREQCSYYGYRSYTCHEIGRCFGSYSKQLMDYKEFIKPHLRQEGTILDESIDIVPMLRIMLIQAFQDEVLSSERYLEY